MNMCITLYSWDMAWVGFGIVLSIRSALLMGAFVNYEWQVRYIILMLTGHIHLWYKHIKINEVLRLNSNFKANSKGKFPNRKHVLWRSGQWLTLWRHLAWGNVLGFLHIPTFGHKSHKVIRCMRYLDFHSIPFL